MVRFSRVIQGGLPIFVGKLFDDSCIKMLAHQNADKFESFQSFQDVADVVTVGSEVPGSKASDQMKRKNTTKHKKSWTTRQDFLSAKV